MPLKFWTSLYKPNGTLDAPPGFDITDYGAEPIAGMGDCMADADPFAFDPDKADAALADVPLDWDKPFVIDTEGDAYAALVNGGANEAAAIQAFEDAADYILAARPSALVGFYSLPHRPEGLVVNAAYNARVAAYDSIFDHVAAVYPSLYRFSNITDPLKYGNLVLKALEVALPNLLPTFCFQWDRFHFSTSQGYQRVPDATFLAHLANCAAQVFSATSIAGHVAWGAPTFYFNAAFAPAPPSTPTTCGYVRCSAMWQKVRNAYLSEGVGAPFQEPFSTFLEIYIPAVYALYQQGIFGGAPPPVDPETPPALASFIDAESTTAGAGPASDDGEFDLGDTGDTGGSDNQLGGMRSTAYRAIVERVRNQLTATHRDNVWITPRPLFATNADVLVQIIPGPGTCLHPRSGVGFIEETFQIAGWIRLHLDHIRNSELRIASGSEGVLQLMDRIRQGLLAYQDDTIIEQVQILSCSPVTESVEQPGWAFVTDTYRFGYEVDWPILSGLGGA